MPRKPSPRAAHLSVIEKAAADDARADDAPDEIATIAPLDVPDALLAIDGAAHAVRAWRTINEWLSQRRRLEVVDEFKLLALCAAIGRWHWVQDQVRQIELARSKASDTTSGRYYKVHGRNGTQHKTHPLVHDEREALKQLATFGSDFGLDPVARMRLLQGATGGAQDSFDF